MAMLKKAATIAFVASAGVVGTAGIASADDGWHSDHQSQQNDNAVHQEGGLASVNALNNVNVSPNFGCLLNQTLPNLTAQGLVGIVPVGVSLNHLLEHTNLNLLANGNNTTEVYDYSCTSNQGSSQAGNNSHGSTGAGSSTSDHHTGNGAGSHNSQNGEGAGGLLGDTGVLGTGTTAHTTGTTAVHAGPISAAPVTKSAVDAAFAAAPMATPQLTGALAHTGADIGAPLAGAGAALLGGAALRLAARKRERANG